MEETIKTAERRRSKRRRARGYFEIVDYKTDQFLGCLADITSTGIMVVSENRLDTGRHYRLKLKLNKEIDCRTHICFEAVGLWCKESIDPGFYNTGFEIINLSDVDRILIEKLTKSSMFDK